MKKELMSKDNYRINLTINCLENGLQVINKAKTAFESLGLRDLTDADLLKMQNGESFIKDVLLEDTNNPEVQGVKICKVKLRDMVEMPTNSNEFILAAKELAEFANLNRNYGFNISFYTINKGEIVLSQIEIDKMIEQYSFYVKTEVESEFMEMAKKLCDVANETILFNNKYGVFDKAFLHDNKLLMFDSHEKTYSINGKYIVSLASGR